MTRKIALLTHESREDVIESANEIAQQLEAAGLDVIRLDGDETDLEAELILVIGGDGTILRAAQMTHGTEIPILGINYGHVGFLAEAEPSALPEVIKSVVDGDWTVDARMTISVEIERPDGRIDTGWALNEVSVEKGPDSRMIETDLGVDGRGLSSFKTDAVLISTPTGSTAYSFSAGGPVVWPDVEAIILTPIAAHALFARPLVVGPSSELSIRIRSDDATVWCDGRRQYAVPVGSVIRATRGEFYVPLARLTDTPFSGRLVKKFRLPVEGWRHGGARD